jgi:hypothetical protein
MGHGAGSMQAPPPAKLVESPSWSVGASAACRTTRRASSPARACRPRRPAVSVRGPLQAPTARPRTGCSQGPNRGVDASGRMTGSKRGPNSRVAGLLTPRHRFRAVDRRRCERRLLARLACAPGRDRAIRIAAGSWAQHRALGRTDRTSARHAASDHAGSERGSRARGLHRRRRATVTSSAAAGPTVIRDAGGLRPRRRFPGGGSPIAVSADGRFVVLAGRRLSLRLLDLRTGRVRALSAGATTARASPPIRGGS